MTNETVAGQGQEIDTKVQAHEETTVSWGGDTMLRSLESLKDNYLAGKELRAKVARLEATIKAQVATINELVNEKVALKARVTEAEDMARAAVSEMEQLRASLDYEKECFVTLNREHDALNSAHQMLREDHDKIRAEHEDALQASGQVLGELADLRKDHEAIQQELGAARAQWFKQEDDLQRAVVALTAERDNFQDKFRKCKSLAATIMQMDKLQPEIVEPQYN
jgi:chromosome segregation ATPase